MRRGLFHLDGSVSCESSVIDGLAKDRPQETRGLLHRPRRQATCEEARLPGPDLFGGDGT